MAKKLIMAPVALFFLTGCPEAQQAIRTVPGISPATRGYIDTTVRLTTAVGNRVGKYLNEQEKERVARATVQTAETGKPQTVSTSTGARVTTTPAAPDAKTKTTTPAAPDAKTKTPAAVETADTATRECRTVTQTIVLKDGKREAENVTVCKGENGLWEAAG